MSKSYKKTPIFGNCNGSDKKDKQLSNRKFRKAIKKDLQTNSDTFSLLREVSESYTFKKDGKHYWKPGIDTTSNEKIEYWKKCLRK